nr:MAG TPA: hypothetical protein [Caudoviricetes sp.]
MVSCARDAGDGFLLSQAGHNPDGTTAASQSGDDDRELTQHDGGRV